jgi:hypothetical protein
MAFSARHLSRTTDFDSAVADHYHHECVSLIIPMLDQKDLVADETLFAAAVILRAFEETNGALTLPEQSIHDEYCIDVIPYRVQIGRRA